MFRIAANESGQSFLADKGVMKVFFRVVASA